jgi:uncharacterized protein
VTGSLPRGRRGLGEPTLQNPTLSELIVYPIKSCAGISVAQAQVTAAGLSAYGVHDREWMLVDEHGECLTQRELPRMATIVPHVDAGMLVLTAAGAGPLSLSLAAAPGAARTVQIWDDVLEGADCGDAPASWFTHLLGRPCRLVRFRPDVVRATSTKWTGGTAAPVRFADGYPLLLIGAESLADLNRRMVAAGHAPVPMNRFRPNLVVDGIPAYEEDYLASLDADGLSLRPVKPCARCPIPSIDQATGIAGFDPISIMLAYRANPAMDGAVCFGMNCIVEGSDAILRVGQPLSAHLAF